MPTRETAIQRATRRSMILLRRIGEELRVARMSVGTSSREEISHTYVLRIERGLSMHVDIGVLERMASVLGCELSMGIHPVGAPVRDKAHIALLGRFAGRLHPSIRWRTEVPIPIPGDLRSADGLTATEDFGAIVEAESRLDDVQAVERRLRANQRDLGVQRAILLVADTRHNRRVIDQVPDLRREFPIGTRRCLAALARGADPGGDCLVIL